VVSIKQVYAGHVKQTAMLASQCAAGAYLGRYVIIVDEDIDIYDFDNIVWALATRVDPAQDIEIVTDCWSGPLDPIIPLESKGINSRALINAAKPYKWRDKFPISAALNAEVKARVKEKWSNLGIFE
jgi:UbiD family decarboxylase